MAWNFRHSNVEQILSFSFHESDDPNYHSQKSEISLNRPVSIVGGSGFLVEKVVVSILSVGLLSSVCLSMSKDSLSGHSSDGRTIHSGPFHQSRLLKFHRRWTSCRDVGRILFSPDEMESSSCSVPNFCYSSLLKLRFRFDRLDPCQDDTRVQLKTALIGRKFGFDVYFRSDLYERTK